MEPGIRKPHFRNAPVSQLPNTTAMKRHRKIRMLENRMPGYIRIRRLENYNLSTSLDAIVETDDGGFIARMPDLPLYGYGEDAVDAVRNLRYEIESLYEDLMEDDDFTEDWLKIKSFLKGVVKENP